MGVGFVESRVGGREDYHGGGGGDGGGKMGL